MSFAKTTTWSEFRVMFSGFNAQFWLHLTQIYALLHTLTLAPALALFMSRTQA